MTRPTQTRITTILGPRVGIRATYSGKSPQHYAEQMAALESQHELIRRRPVNLADLSSQSEGRRLSEELIVSAGVVRSQLLQDCIGYVAWANARTRSGRRRRTRDWLAFQAIVEEDRYRSGVVAVDLTVAGWRAWMDNPELFDERQARNAMVAQAGSR